MTIQKIIVEAKRDILSRGLASPQTRLNGLKHLENFLYASKNAMDLFAESKELFIRKFEDYKGKSINGAEKSCVSILFAIYQNFQAEFPQKENHRIFVAIPKLSFPPVVDEKSKILILGTMPGETSLKSGEYYADPHNPFWKIIQKLFHDDVPFTSYQEKLKCMHDHHIALWDVYHDCLREGSLDSQIRDGNNNDIKTLLETHPSIKRVVLNGRKAASAFVTSTEVKVIEAVSLSAYIKFEEKLRLWKSYLTVE